MEYVQTFDKGEFNPQAALTFAQMVSNPMGLMGKVD